MTEWRVRDHTFRLRYWDDELVVYHDESGDTHRLNPIAARAFELLRHASLSTSELGGRLSAEFGPGDTGPEVLSSAVKDILSRFQELGITTPAHRPSEPGDVRNERSLPTTRSTGQDDSR